MRCGAFNRQRSCGFEARRKRDFSGLRTVADTACSPRLLGRRIAGSKHSRLGPTTLIRVFSQDVSVKSLLLIVGESTVIVLSVIRAPDFDFERPGSVFPVCRLRELPVAGSDGLGRPGDVLLLQRSLRSERRTPAREQVLGLAQALAPGAFCWAFCICCFLACWSVEVSCLSRWH